MKSDLIIDRIPHGTDEWYQYRLNGIGGSEVGTVLGINKYDTNVRLFHEKIGSIEQKRLDNERMMWGRVLEEKVADVWQYYDGTQEGYVENYAQGKIIRKCRNVFGYIRNPKYPWLFASIDRLINIEGGFNLITGEPLKMEGILECKAMSYWVNKMWDEGIPIQYLAQIHQYMAILETDYAEIAMLVDSGRFVLEKIQRDDELVEKILSITKDWWYNRVLPAKEALKKRDIADSTGNMMESEKWDAEIQKLEPDPDESEAYKDFMEEKFVEERVSVVGTMELYSLARKDNFLRKFKTKIDKERTWIKNMFIKYMTVNGAETIDFGNLGVVNWSKRKGAKNRTFNNRTKETPSEDYLDKEFQKLDYNNF